MCLDARTIFCLEVEAELILAMGCDTLFRRESLSFVAILVSREDLMRMELCVAAAVIMRYEVLNSARYV